MDFNNKTHRVREEEVDLGLHLRKKSGERDKGSWLHMDSVSEQNEMEGFCRRPMCQLARQRFKREYY